jgi:hypothetical protein
MMEYRNSGEWDVEGLEYWNDGIMGGTNIPLFQYSNAPIGT